MPLSTSGFSRYLPRASWSRIWLTGLVLLVSALCALEMFWRANGHIPSIVDNCDLWAYYRNRVNDNGTKTIVLLGASRIQLDVSTSVLRNRFLDYTVIQLAVDGQQPIAVLKDLAGDKHFKGTVICSMVAAWIGKENLYGQQGYVDYFHKDSTLSKRLNRVIVSSVQEHFDIIDPYLQPKRILLNFIESGRLPPTRYLITKHDRSRMADYSMINIARQRKYRIKRIMEFYRKDPPVAIEKWLNHAAGLQPYVKKLQDRGGVVVFVRFPSTGKHWVLDNKAYPKKEYWDKLAGITGAKTIHFMDIDDMKQFDCPDSSHLDYRQAPLFTDILANELVKRRIMKKTG